jgi:TRAP-type uncharacterized transport system fused permease subunit
VDDPNEDMLELPRAGRSCGDRPATSCCPSWCLVVHLIERLSPALSAFWATLAMIFVVLTQHPLKSVIPRHGLYRR